MTSTPPTRAGLVALVGLPNAGKSTLMNAILGQKLSIATAKAQTTWRQVLGIHSSEFAQLVILDTPGLLDVRDLLQRSMLEEARGAIRDADLILLVVDATRPPEDAKAAVTHGVIHDRSVPLFIAVNKSDAVAPSVIDGHVHSAEQTLGGRPFVVSATTGEGVSTLVEALEQAVPLSPFLYPEDQVASESQRFFVSELIRETVFEQFEQEIPYCVFCSIEDFREEQNPIYIQATLFVERESQKKILIGRGGAAIRDLGHASRRKVEDLIGSAVYLDLWVKTLPDWRRKRNHLARFGFRVPEDHDQQS